MDTDPGTQHDPFAAGPRAARVAVHRVPERGVAAICGLCWRDPCEAEGRLVAMYPHLREELKLCRECYVAVQRLFSIVGDELRLVAREGLEDY